MGGGTFGNHTPLAEFNVWADPEAAWSATGPVSRVLPLSSGSMAMPSNQEDQLSLRCPSTRIS